MAGVLPRIDEATETGHRWLGEQARWLIRLRWGVVVLIAVGAVLGTYVFPVLSQTGPLLAVAAVLLGCNLIYAALARRYDRQRGWKHSAFVMVQIEVDLVLLTAVLHFAGGVANPFFLFYVFHVIIATIILPRTLSFIVGVSTVALFGLLAVNELNRGDLLGYYPLQLSAGGALWRNPVYGLAAFAAFACTIMLAQYLTRMIVARMMSKEWEAARNNDVLKAVINAMAEGLIFVAGGEVALCNPAARQWQRRAGRKHGDVVDSFPEALADYIRELAAPGGRGRPGPARIDFRTRGPAGRFVEARSCPVAGPDGRQLGYVIVGQDLTEHKKLEADLLARTEQISEINEMLKMSHIRMAQREKMVALGQMAAGIAHEIGNPLSSLSSVVQYLTRKCPPGELKESCTVIDHQVERIAAILKRMLSLAKPATAEYKWTDTNEVIENALSLVRFDKRARGVAISNHAGAPTPVVWLNPQNLEQCLLNILINALDAMSAKGAGFEHRLEVATAVEDDMLEIRVSDTGVGMSPEVCRRAFESFFTTKEISRGTGLGLYVSYNLLAEMDGSIELESEPDVGTTAVVRVPVRPKHVLIGGAASRRSAS